MLSVRKIEFKTNSDEYGKLVPVEQMRDIPFDIKRVYYIFDVAAHVRRGFHSHAVLNQVLICLGGSVKILVKTPEEEQIIELNNPSSGLYIGPMVWREMYDFTPNATLLVLADAYYDESEYIRDYSKYQALWNAQSKADDNR